MTRRTPQHARRGAGTGRVDIRKSFVSPAAVIALPTRPPLLTTRQVASLDLVSNGRIRLDIGTGYLEPELIAAGVAMSERGSRTEEYLEALRAIWSMDPID
ncbi:LLM class flavin-dependent oxidoreductase [Mycobacteroides chelonae]|uniref:LLM class flavin-dependent oxidoreductase n=1 Tax=Mycobacteroides chelonae TaxID=1774 RepID=UPI0013F4DD7C